jgi:hypothetical protein
MQRRRSDEGSQPVNGPLPGLGYDPLRACRLCSHRDRTSPAEAPLCRNPQVSGGLYALHCANARKPYGACGPEATHLDFPGLIDLRR